MAGFGGRDADADSDSDGGGGGRGGCCSSATWASWDRKVWVVTLLRESRFMDLNPRRVRVLASIAIAEG